METRTAFHQELDDIRRDLVQVAARVIDAISRGTEALLDHDLGTAQALIDGDDEIDALTLAIEERCFTVLALQGPVAGDLRAVIAAIRLTSEIERSGDLMVNVAKVARRLFGSEMPAQLRGLLTAMAEEATRLLGLAMDAYASGDAALAGALDDLDDRLDQLHRDYIQALLQLGSEGPDVEMAVQLGLVGRYYERIGDHAVNIGERVQYMITGWLPEHTGAARAAARGDSATSEPPGGPSDVAARPVGAVPPHGVVLFDEHGEVTFANDEAERYLDLRPGEALVEEAVRQLAQAAQGGVEPEPRSLELSGPPRRVLVVRAVPLRRRGRHSGVLVVVDDVTDRRRLEAVRRDFIANISHELKTPVGALALLAETLASEEDPDVAKRLTQRLVVEAERVSRTIDDLLELSRIEIGQVDRREVVAVGDLVAEALEQARTAADRRGIAIEAADVPAELSVTGDRRQLRSALCNLVDNAVKYSEPGDAVAVRATADATGVTISVEDHGVGIPRRDLERVFERFYRVDRARSRDTGGTGLGLSIVRHVADNHGGEVRVESTEGVGSTFTLRLPAAPVEPDPAAG